MAKKTPHYRTAIMNKNVDTLKKGDNVFIEEKVIKYNKSNFFACLKKGISPVKVTRSEFEFTDKEKFVVTVSRISYSSRNIEVVATDRKEAERLATEQAGDFEFREHDADYKADAIYTKREHENLF